MNLKQIEAFVKIANNNSFSLTAQEMYLTQPTISSAIKSLEDELGMTLFIRNPKGVELTEDGKQIYLYAKQMYESSKAILKISRTGSEKSSVSNELIISASSIPAQFLLPEIMADFNETYPETRFRVNISDSEQVFYDIENHLADIGFCGTEPKGKSFVSVPFCRDELVVITPNNSKYSALKGTPAIEWAVKEPLILREDGSGTKTEALMYLISKGISPSGLNTAIKMGSSNAIIRAVRKGLGISFISKLAAADEVNAGHILQFPLDENGVFRKIYIVYNAAFPRTETVRRFFRMVKDKYSEN